MSGPILYGVWVAIGTNNVLSVDIILFIVHRHANANELYFRDQTPWLLIFPSAETSGDYSRVASKTFLKFANMIVYSSAPYNKHVDTV